MKKVLLAVILIALCYFGARYFSKQLTYCSPQDLQATTVWDAGAGNVYGTFSIKNISDKPCQIIADNYLTPVYDRIKYPNLTVSRVDEPESQRFNLPTNQSVSSQVHYPNGPQCSSDIKTAPIQFAYRISPTEKVSFEDAEGNKDQQITVCSAIADITTLDIGNLSAKPLTH